MLKKKKFEKYLNRSLATAKGTWRFYFQTQSNGPPVLFSNINDYIITITHHNNNIQVSEKKKQADPIERAFHIRLLYKVNYTQ